MKRILISLTDRTEMHLRSGRLYSIDRLLERRGQEIHLNRSYVAHPTISGIRSIMLPSLHLWAIFFDGTVPPYGDVACYMHMARIRDLGDLIEIEDLYLDVVLMQDGSWRLVDIDEFRQAVAAGELTPDLVDAALEGLENACSLIDRCRGNFEEFLRGKLTAAG